MQSRDRGKAKKRPADASAPTQSTQIPAREPFQLPPRPMVASAVHPSTIARRTYQRDPTSDIEGDDLDQMWSNLAQKKLKVMPGAWTGPLFDKDSSGNDNSHGADSKKSHDQPYLQRFSSPSFSFLPRNSGQSSGAFVPVHGLQPLINNIQGGHEFERAGTESRGAASKARARIPNLPPITHSPSSLQLPSYEPYTQYQQPSSRPTSTDRPRILDMSIIGKALDPTQRPERRRTPTESRIELGQKMIDVCRAREDLVRQRAMSEQARAMNAMLLSAPQGHLRVGGLPTEPAQTGRIRPHQRLERFKLEGDGKGAKCANANDDAGGPSVQPRNEGRHRASSTSRKDKHSREAHTSSAAKRAYEARRSGAGLLARIEGGVELAEIARRHRLDERRQASASAKRHPRPLVSAIGELTGISEGAKAAKTAKTSQISFYPDPSPSPSIAGSQEEEDVVSEISRATRDEPPDFPSPSRSIPTADLIDLDDSPIPPTKVPPNLEIFAGLLDPITLFNDGLAIFDSTSRWDGIATPRMPGAFTTSEDQTSQLPGSPQSDESSSVTPSPQYEMVAAGDNQPSETAPIDVHQDDSAARGSSGEHTSHRGELHQIPPLPKRTTNLTGSANLRAGYHFTHHRQWLHLASILLTDDWLRSYGDLSPALSGKKWYYNATVGGEHGNLARAFANQWQFKELTRVHGKMTEMMTQAADVEHGLLE